MTLQSLWGPIIESVKTHFNCCYFLGSSDMSCTTTSDSNVPNKPCIFPYIFDGIYHDKCSFHGACVTLVDAKGQDVTQHWGYCDQNCCK